MNSRHVLAFLTATFALASDATAQERNPPSPAKSVDLRLQHDVAFAALDTLLAELVPADSLRRGRIACVAMSPDKQNVDARTGQRRPEEPSEEMLGRLQRVRLTVVPARRCPPTFGSPALLTRGDGSYDPYPPGEDPYVFTVRTVTLSGDDRATVSVDRGYSTSGRSYRCSAVRDATRFTGWRADCRADREWVH